MADSGNAFSLAGLRSIRGGAGSRWMKLIPGRVYRVGAGALNPMIWGVLASQQVALLRTENVVRNPDLVSGP